MIGTIYSPEIYLAIRKTKPPHPFVMHVVEYPTGLTLRVYEDDIMKFSEDQRKEIMEYLQEIVNIVRAHGVNCLPEGVKGGPE